MVEGKFKIFVSYSHQNEDWVSNNGKYKFIPWLEMQLADVAEIWTDRILKRLPGEEFTKLITEKVNEADFALLLISQDFVSSKYIMDIELPIIMQRYHNGKIEILPFLLTGLTKKSRKKIEWILKLEIYPNETKPLIEFVNNDADWTQIKIEILEGVENRIEERVLNKTKKEEQDYNNKDRINVPEVNYNEDKSFCGNSGTFIDDRDGQKYKWIRIGSQIWMNENLAFKIESGSWAYNNNPININKYGCLYEWGIAKNVCPNEWHLLSKEEWLVLENFFIKQGYNFKRINAKIKFIEGITAIPFALLFRKPNLLNFDFTLNNESGFSIILGGYRSYSEFSGIDTSGNWWSSTEYNKELSWYECLLSNNENLKLNFFNKSYGFSVRCIKD